MIKSDHFHHLCSTVGIWILAFCLHYPTVLRISCTAETLTAHFRSVWLLYLFWIKQAPFQHMVCFHALHLHNSVRGCFQSGPLFELGNTKHTLCTPLVIFFHASTISNSYMIFQIWRETVSYISWFNKERLPSQPQALCISISCFLGTTLKALSLVFLE